MLVLNAVFSVYVPEINCKLKIKLIYPRSKYLQMTNESFPLRSKEETNPTFVTPNIKAKEWIIFLIEVSEIYNKNKFEGEENFKLPYIQKR